MSVNAGAQYFNLANYTAAGNTNTVQVTGSATGAVDWAVAESATPTVFSTLSGAVNVPLSSGQGTRTVSALFRDAVGNVTPVVATDGIEVDTTPPSLTSITLTGTLADGTASEATTVTQNVQVSLTHSGAVGLFVGDGALPSCPAAGYSSFTGASASITLPGSGSPRTVRLCVSDAAGNTAGYAQDTIAYDAIVPSGCALTLLGRRTDGTTTSGATADKTALTTVSASLGSCSEAPTEIYLLEAGSVSCAAATSLPWQTYTAGSTNFILTGGDASKTVVGCVRDAARNVSTIVADAITLDTTPPTAATVSLHAGAAYFNRTAWTTAGNLNRMNVTGNATGAAEWAFAEGTAPTSYAPFSSPTSTPTTFSVGDGTKTVRALFRDDVGNTTAAEATDTIEVDTDAPVLTSLSVTGTLADGTTSTSITTSTSVTVNLN
ncbi:MAG TPA: hypothetical protein VGF99_07515, partial [Myxococcota bacterium]